MYGGGGITPDIFVAEDTTGITSYYRAASATGLILQFAYSYTDANRQQLKEYDDEPKLSIYLAKQNMVDKFATFANSNGLQRRNLMIKKSHTLLETYINSRVIYNMLDEQAWLQYLNERDNTIKAALDFFKNKDKKTQKK